MAVASIPEEEYLNITQVARQFKVASSLIRYWESEFDILNPAKDEKGNRLYSTKDIESLRMVYHLVKEQGYTLQGAKRVLKEQGDEATAKLQAINSLEGVKALLQEIREKLG